MKFKMAHWKRKHVLYGYNKLTNGFIWYLLKHRVFLEYLLFKNNISYA